MAATAARGAPPRYEGFTTMPLGGSWRPGSSGKTAADTDPWSGKILTELPLADPGDLDEAVTAAEQAQREWASRSPANRADIMLTAAAVMQDRRLEITDWLVRETGATVARAQLEWNLTRAAILSAACVPYQVTGRIEPSDLPGRQNRVYRVPAGVVAVISPWNSPMRLSSRSAAPALAAGNAVILKPSSDTPVTGGLLLAKIYQEAGLPTGLLSVVIGSGDEIGQAIGAHPVPRVICFAGSEAAGAALARHAEGKRLARDTGGSGPFVVLDDADLGRAVDAAVFGSFSRQDQICMIANRIVVDRKVYHEFAERFLTVLGCLRAGNPAAADTDIGPVINARQLSLIQDQLDRARGDGARQVLGGQPGGPSGLLLPPHVLLAGHQATSREEISGPVATIVRAKDEQDALRVANQAGYGRSGAVFTADIERGARFALGLDAGLMHVNDSPANDDATTSLSVARAIDDFTAECRVSVPAAGPDSPAPATG
jgi:aldehyde dehydrogenase (NAD+)